MSPVRWGQVALMLAAVALFAAVGLFTLVVNQRTEQRDIACNASEGAHLEEIRDLRQAYDYFENPPRAFAEYLRTDPRAAMELRDLERKARRDFDEFGVFVAPYCDDPGMGRPEIGGRDPVLPVRPDGLP